MLVIEQYGIRGRGASEIAVSIEQAILGGRLSPGDSLPTVRGLSAALHISPGTAAAAYRSLRLRGLIGTAGRRGTIVSALPPLSPRPVVPLGPEVRDLAGGAPDPVLLPNLAPLLAGVAPSPINYGAPPCDPALVEMARASFAVDRLPPGPITVVGGALDGIERVLQAWLRPGDQVVVEDPGYFAVFDLLRALGLNAIPVTLDGEGPAPEALAQALARGANALIVTPRAQNPTGAALTSARASALRRILARHPDLLVIEDDHAGPIAGQPVFSLVEAGRARFAIVRSVSKWLGPDLRLALLTGDPLTIGRVEGRRQLGAGWVSHILQKLVVKLWSDHESRHLVRRAAGAYGRRRETLIAALNHHGITAEGRSGLNVWIPVREESALVQAMRAAGWAVMAGERFRVQSGPAIRVSIGALAAPAEIARFAEDFARAAGAGARTRAA
jgi:DNA-binding transcriptional MocR family regulator